MQLPYISPYDKTYQFPSVNLALQEPNGLLAFGGDLSPKRLLSAYRHGIFPWFNDDQPILWWTPDPRMILRPAEIHVSRSLKKTMKKSLLRFTYDQAFADVIEACSQPREKQKETWITDDMKQAYRTLHELGYAHSFEVWDEDKLVGGLYGIAIGQVFFGESMFSRQSNASKIAFAQAVECLIAWGYQMIDCQVETEYLQSFGATNISRDKFIELLTRYVDEPISSQAWKAAQNV